MKTPEQKVAEYLHSYLCRWNHIDQCGWEYSGWDNPGHARKKYLEKATYLIKRYGVEEAIQMVDEHKRLSGILK